MDNQPEQSNFPEKNENENVEEIPAEENVKKQKSIFKRVLKAVGIFFAVVFVILIIFIFVVPRLLSVFWGEDIAPVNDSDMQLEVINIPEAENGFYDLVKIKDVINTENIPEGVNMINDYLNSDEWDSNETAILINDNKLSFKYFDAAAQKGKFQSPAMDDPDKISMESPITAMSQWREMARLSGVKTIWLAKQGKSDDALREAFKPIIIGDAMERSQGSLITYLTGIAMKDAGFDILQKVISISKPNSTILEKYQDELKKYNMSNNTAQFKIEYLTTKNVMSVIASGKINFSEEKQLPINHFYFKPNLTVSYSYDFYRDIISEFQKPCSDIKTIQPKEMPKYDSILGKIKLYFTENAIGKMLYSVAAVSLNNIKTKKCDNQAKLESLRNEISAAIEAAPKADAEIDSDNDGLSDAEEIIYGTDINNPDSDGDGYLDGDEVRGGYNPNGEGKIPVN